MTEVDGMEMSTYAELAEVIQDLPIALRSARRMLRLPMREVGVRAGVSASTVFRAEAGEDLRMDSLVALLRWLDNPAGGEV